MFANKPPKVPPPLHLDDLPGGPTAGTPLAPADLLAESGATGLDIAATAPQPPIKAILVRQGQELHMFENRCPHAGTALNEFSDDLMESRGRWLMCGTHGAQFDPQTGRCVRGPCKGAHLRRIAISIIDGTIVSA